MDATKIKYIYTQLKHTILPYNNKMESKCLNNNNNKINV